VSELDAILALRDVARARGVPSVLAQLVRVVGSHYRRAGARMLLTGDGRAVGALSGGCLEGDLLVRVPAVLAGGSAIAVDYDMRAPADLVWGLGLGCDGAVRILMEPLDGSHDGHLDSLARAARGRRTGLLATVAREARGAPLGARLLLDGGVLTADARFDADVACSLGAALRAAPRSRATHSGTVLLPGGAEALLEVLRPPIRLLVCGTGPDVPPLVRLARELGWGVGVVATSPAAAARVASPAGVPAVSLEALLSLDDRTAVVVMTHAFARDVEVLRTLAARPPRYVGVLGPRARTERLLGELGPARTRLACALRSPVGLDVGAETPEEIALAIVAEVQCVTAVRRGGALCDLAGPLHERETENGERGAA
jgi:xanthine dehydrogenase accessory factor